MSSRAYRILPTEGRTFHPRLLGTRGAVASSSNLSASAGADVLKSGGNAIDAAVVASFVEGLVNPQMHTIGGECPMLVRLAGFFAPHASEPNRVRIEPRFGDKVLDELRRRGHDLDVAPDWTEGFVPCAAFDGDTGLVEAGCDPRGSKSECFPAFAMAW